MKRTPKRLSNTRRRGETALRRKVITFGTFDLLHEGHLRILERAKSEGDLLIVGVSSDALNAQKGKRSIFSQSQRLAYISALKFVDEVFLEESLELKDEYIRRYGADLLVMGDDWEGKFDWVSCDVKYLPRTPDVSSTMIKATLNELPRGARLLFGDTYLAKHRDCANSLLNEMLSAGLTPIFTGDRALPEGIEIDALVYFNRPATMPPACYADRPRILIDHGASHLKWFLGSRERFEFFDLILTAGPDHVRALSAIFPESEHSQRVRSPGFVKSAELLANPRRSRESLCREIGLDSRKPIVLFAPTWHITANADMVEAMHAASRIPNIVASFHPETANLPIDLVPRVDNVNGMTAELIKHADIVISDLSSTIYEAAALGKPVVQLLMSEYPDNTAVLYDFPLSAGTAEHFCGGFFCRPADLEMAVDRILAGDPTVQDLMAACQQRILAGTVITAEASARIIQELASVSRSSMSYGMKGTAEGRGVISPPYVSNLFFARNRVIAHGGGDYGPHHASNSREAVTAALNACNIVELDFCLGKDGVIVAHDSFESRYGLQVPFSEVEESEFIQCRFDGRLQPLSLEDAVSLCTRSGKGLVCDIKPGGEGYREVAAAIRAAADKVGDISRLVIQCYSSDDFRVALDLGFSRAMLPVWKSYYRDPLGAAALGFMQECLDLDRDAVWGISLPWQNKHMRAPIVELPEFLSLHGHWKRVFVHGAPVAEYASLLRSNVGLFADRITPSLEFGDVPEGFNWRQYLFLNPDLIRANRTTEVEAIAHYLRYGRGEGRRFAYEVPDGFSYLGYLNKNSKLRRLSINGIDSASAHYTRFGGAEGLDF